MEEQSQVEELQKTVQEQGSKADDVSSEIFVVTIIEMVLGIAFFIFFFFLVITSV